MELVPVASEQLLPGTTLSFFTNFSPTTGVSESTGEREVTFLGVYYLSVYQPDAEGKIMFLFGKSFRTFQKLTVWNPISILPSPISWTP